MKPLVTTTMALLTLLSASAAAAEQAPAQALAPATPAWVARSNVNAQYLLAVQAPFNPERASDLGLAEYDSQVADLRPGSDARERAALAKARDELKARLAREADEPVQQDLQILIDAAEENIKGSKLQEQYLLGWVDVPRQVFSGLRGLLDDQTPPERRAKAVERLNRYAGLAPNTQAMTQLAIAYFNEGLGHPERLYPFKLELDRALANAPTYLKGIREGFEHAGLKGHEPALAALEKQFDAYQNWTKETVLPKARTDFRLPPALYAFRLQQVGIDIDPQALVQRGQLEYAETRAAMQALAPQIARARGEPVTSDYRAVIRALKKNQLDRSAIEPYYKGINKQLEAIIAREKIVNLPERPMIMRLASDAESAAQPAPHFLPAPLIGNTGQQGQFVLPLDNPGVGTEGKYDDFNYQAAAWTLSAHEGRPGHELQFTALIERGVSLARSIFAFNSVNVEGWALYAEAESLPYEPLEGQMIALQLRMLRAARAMLDPMLNLGLIDRERAGKVLREEVMLSEPMARQELDRYTFKAPGQAGSYFYGYSRLMQLRTETELRLGERFDRKAFNNFVLDLGLLPPDLVANAVRARFEGAAPGAGKKN